MFQAGCGKITRIRLEQERDKCRALANTVTNVLIS
jgi:hypothetical protein